MKAGTDGRLRRRFIPGDGGNGHERAHVHLRTLDDHWTGYGRHLRAAKTGRHDSGEQNPNGRLCPITHAASDLTTNGGGSSEGIWDKASLRIIEWRLGKVEGGRQPSVVLPIPGTDLEETP